VKWEDLQYDQCESSLNSRAYRLHRTDAIQACWDTPPPKDSVLYPAYLKALGRFLQARQVEVPVLTASEARKRDADAQKPFVPPQEQPECIVGGVCLWFHDLGNVLMQAETYAFPSELLQGNGTRRPADKTS
jgi:hypothetical protein